MRESIKLIIAVLLFVAEVFAANNVRTVDPRVSGSGLDFKEAFEKGTTVQYNIAKPAQFTINVPVDVEPFPDGISFMYEDRSTGVTNENTRLLLCVGLVARQFSDGRAPSGTRYFTQSKLVTPGSRTYTFKFNGISAPEEVWLWNSILLIAAPGENRCSGKVAYPQTLDTEKIIRENFHDHGEIE